jgi:sensor histidine kinase regulating citrate/malate metabolism
MVPVLSTTTRETIGVVGVGRQYPTALENLAAAAPNLLTYVGIASVLGILGSLLLSRRVKRQTLGLEPQQIAGLVEHREAMLHGIKEGVIALDLQNRITLINDQAATLLGVSSVSTGRPLSEVVTSRHLLSVLTGPTAGTDRIVPAHGRVLTLNRMPIVSRGRRIGWVTTLRDRTELLELQRELDVTRETTTTLRVQAHEFSNRMHVVSGLIELGEYDDARSYIRHISADQTQLNAAVTSRVDDPAVAALLIAKSSLAVERGVRLLVDESTRLERIDEELSTDVSTVLGNLVDNALDAVSGSDDGEVYVNITSSSAAVTICVRDTGPGVTADLAERVFAHGFTTKVEESHSKRGIGLALTRLICRRRGGDVTVHNDSGAVFSAVLPVAGRADAR